MKVARGTAVLSALAGGAVLLLFAAGPAAAKTYQKTAPPESWAAAELDDEGDIRLVVIQREGAGAERSAERMARRSLGSVKRSFKRIGGDVIKVRPERLAEVLAELEADPDVEAAAPDARDQRLGGQVVPWGITRIHADPVTRGTNSGAGIKLAVIDTGIWASAGGGVHPDLAAAYRGGYDFVNADPSPWDDHGHGTHVAGIIAATNNAVGVVGVAPGVSLYALKVLAADGRGYISDFIAALDWCIEHGVRVVNYSAGGESGWGPMEVACDRARAAGITVVAAAGNESGPVIYPAAYASVIAVGSTDSYNRRSYFSNYGAELDLVAPGEPVRSTYLGDGYVSMMGTSMAAPHVAGAAALLAKRGVTFPRLVQDYLQATALDRGAAGFDTYYGHGRLDAGPVLPARPVFLSPLAGESVPSGIDTLVSWEPVPEAATYRVLYARKGGAAWTELEAATSATSTLWRPPVVGQPLTTARLQVAAYDGGGRLLSVRTRDGFVVRSLRIAAPAAGATVPGGLPLDLTWEVYATPRTVAAVAVELSQNGGKSWTRLANLAAAARSYGWQTPSLAAAQNVRLRVILTDGAGAAIATSAVSFTVAPALP